MESYPTKDKNMQANQHKPSIFGFFSQYFCDTLNISNKYKNIYLYEPCLIYNYIHTLNFL